MFIQVSVTTCLAAHQCPGSSLKEGNTPESLRGPAREIVRDPEPPHHGTPDTPHCEPLTYCALGSQAHCTMSPINAPPASPAAAPVPCLSAALLLPPLLPCANSASPLAPAALITPQEQREVEKPPGVIRAGSHNSHPLTVLSNRDQHQALAAGASRAVASSRWECWVGAKNFQ
ncbi:hypothetical protein MDA_GLEAN10013925 [Myotis davidii]|uniref:Uncharacterized protein n=1 Tax=Myotis davidii TaxID=225400 RepID=L5LJC8_MYODS|nr:hypothetical protein MDA_GLEAN10013925 [Myotis davidii]